MRPGRPSGTALRVAMRRAAHQGLDDPRVFEDPLALAILPAEAAAEVRATVAAAMAAAMAGAAGTAAEESPLGRGLRAFIAVRSRFAEDELAQAVARGVEQCVVLGAGLDTFAYRNPYPTLRVFEVDHPDTQDWKRHLLRAAGIPLPASLAFAPVDFERQSLAEELLKAGLRRDRPAFFPWLGVAPYLQADTAFATLRTLVTLHPANAVVFDYAVPPDTLSPRERAAHDALARRVAAAGEPFRSWFKPAELARELAAAGYRHIEDLDAEAINARYFAGRRDGLRLAGSAAHLLSARGDA